MKYLFITFEVQDGNRRYTLRQLHTTNADNIMFAAERYVASFFSNCDGHQDDWWWFEGEYAARLYDVKELSLAEYGLISKYF